MSGVVVVGAGIAGVRAAEALRGQGYSGPVTIIGAEQPVYRPAVSKDALRHPTQGDYGFPYRRSVDDLTWMIGSSVQSVDLTAKSLVVRSTDGTTTPLAFDGIVIASGLSSRHLGIAGPKAGRHSLRTLADAQALQPHLKPGIRLTVIGSGFVGCEVASTARQLGCTVTMVAPEDVPLASAVGDEVGQIIARRLQEREVSLLARRTVLEYRGRAQVQEVVLDDDTFLATDIVVEAVGSTTNVAWLEDNGLDLSNGVLTDAYLRVVGAQAPAVACGDIARHPNAHFGPATRRIEHWTAAADMGSYAGRVLAGQLTGIEPDFPAFASIPAFWSDQFDFQIQSFGIPMLGEATNFVERDDDGSCIVEYLDDQGVVGVVGINRTAELARYRKVLGTRRDALAGQPQV
ncbi:MAG: FAD-dependent oxidoreductase [Candidatus Nanopelagicales bacterium]